MKKEKKRYKRIVKMKEFDMSNRDLRILWLEHGLITTENQGVRESKGELIVFLQDYIHIKTRCTWRNLVTISVKS